MSMFSSIMSKIFGASQPLAKAGPTSAPAATPGVTPTAPTAPAVAAAATQAAPTQAVDVEKLLAEKAGKNPEKLDWKKSIVDLLKLLELDSSLAARKSLAIELGYSQADIDKKGSAEMNMWLHKQVIRKIAENGGKVPASLLD